jgi:hypothetical protein
MEDDCSKTPILQPHGECTVSVAFLPGSEGLHQATLTKRSSFLVQIRIETKRAPSSVGDAVPRGVTRLGELTSNATEVPPRPQLEIPAIS